MTFCRQLASMRTARKSPVLALMSLEPIIGGVNHDTHPCDKCL